MKCTDNLKALAERGHAGQFRKDGTTPYIEHPRAVVALLGKWGVTDGVTLAIAWGHDLLEDTRIGEGEILAAGGPKHGAAILAGIKALTRDEKAWPDKKAWLREVARTAQPAALLVKAADRICNTRDFLALGDPAKARDYLAQGAPVFALAPKAEIIAGELELVRGEIDEAENPGLTELYFVLDRSGSMGGLVGTTVAGFNEMLEKQSKSAKGELNVSTVLFGDTSEVLHSHVPIARMRPLTEAEYRIGGCTALLDALGDSIAHAVGHQRHAPENKRAKNVVFVVITDGMENASRKYGAVRIRQMVEKETRDYGWEFLYLGANIDAFAAARDIGIDASRAANFVPDPAGVAANFADLAEAVVTVREEPRREREKRFGAGDWKRRIDRDWAARGGTRS